MVEEVLGRGGEECVRSIKVPLLDIFGLLGVAVWMQDGSMEVKRETTDDGGRGSTADPKSSVSGLGAAHPLASASASAPVSRGMQLERTTANGLRIDTGRHRRAAGRAR